MSITGNYQAAFELSEQIVKEVFLAAHESGEMPSEILVNSQAGGYTYDSIVKILQTGTAGDLDVSFNTSVNNGIKMSLPLDVEVNIQNCPAPSINPIQFQAKLDITAPVQGLPDSSGNKELVLNMANLPNNQVAVTMPSDPIVQVTSELIQDGMHEAFRRNLIPHNTPFLDIVNDDENTDRQIKFQIDDQPTVGHDGHGTLTLPVIFKIFDPGESTITIANIGLIRSSESLTIRFSTVTAGDITINPSLGLADAVAAGQIAGFINTKPDYTVPIPSNDTVASFIRTESKNRLDTWGADGNGRIHLYTPNAVENSPIEIRDFDVKVKPGFLAVLFNPRSNANPDDVENFIPSGKKFAQAMDEPAVQEIIKGALDEHILQENGCSGWPCKFDHKIEGHNVKIWEPKFSLKDGYMKMTGSAEVAIDCWFDPDVDFEAKVNFYFDTDANGNKIIKPNVYGEDLDLSCLDWFLGFIIPIYGWICLIVVNVVIESVGGDVMSAEGDAIADGTHFIAGEIHGVGNVETDLDQIDIKPSGIILSGGITVSSAQYALTVVPSESGAPYSGAAASTFYFSSLYTHPMAKHLWKLGDGNTKSGKNINHIYIEDGIYILKLESDVNVPRKAITHHFARVKVEKVSPDVNAGSDVVAYEGEVINFFGRFRDKEWKDTHVARWLWGDNSLSEGTVTETNDPPHAEGTVTGKHAFCDNGEYTVTLFVIDDDGAYGKDTCRVRIRNVAPTVKTKKSVFAYPCTPINLIAEFTDPGWCDTHIAYWNFGDCTPTVPATVVEKNDPPIGFGIAVATNTYQSCGAYHAECTVIDDDGGIGRDTLIVNVIDVLNKDFEDGFRNRYLGAVANEWEPYASSGRRGYVTVGDDPFANSGGFQLLRSEEFIVRDGRRSQRMLCHLGQRIGILQQVGANPGWDYQTKTWYHLDQNLGGICRLGVDPTGGINPESSKIVWSEGGEQQDWEQLLVRVTAEGNAITIFLEANSDDHAANAYFDSVSLVPYPCPLPEPVPPEIEEPEGRKVCVDWSEEKNARTLPPVYEKNGFTFISRDKQQLELVVWGIPEDVGKLLLRKHGIAVRFPFDADKVEVTVTSGTQMPVTIKAYNDEGEEIAHGASQHNSGAPETVTLIAKEMVGVYIAGSLGRELLVRICIYDGSKAKDEEEREKEKTNGSFNHYRLADLRKVNRKGFSALDHIDDRNTQET